jgi:hypothetical protein
MSEKLTVLAEDPERTCYRESFKWEPIEHKCPESEGPRQLANGIDYTSQLLIPLEVNLYGTLFIGEKRWGSFSLPVYVNFCPWCGVKLTESE